MGGFVRRLPMFAGTMMVEWYRSPLGVLVMNDSFAPTNRVDAASQSDQALKL